MNPKTILAGIVFFYLLSASDAGAQGLMKVPFPYSLINASSLPFMIAKDAKIFEKYGLEIKQSGFLRELWK